MLPDPEFAPMVAAWLSALVAAADRPSAQRARLTAALVPPAAPDPTALDTVLGRLVVALHPADDVLAELVRVLSDRQTSEPAGGWEAGVA